MWRNGGVKYHGRTSRFVFVCLLVSLLIAISAPAQTPEAQIDLTLAGRAPRPTSGAAAWLSIPARRQAVVAFLACGQELQFLSGVRAGDSGPDAVNYSVAKMYWFAGMPDRNGVPLLPSPPNVVNATPSCQQQVQIRFDQGPADDAARRKPFERRVRSPLW